VPTEPEPSVWATPDPQSADSSGIAAIGADLAPGTLLAAYRAGLFPMRLGGVGRRRGGAPLAWWSPDPRAIVPLDRPPHVSRSLRRSMRRFTFSVDAAFEEVMRGCGDPARPHGWIDDEFVDAYVRLHDLGWAHSFEVWSDDGLAGGLYGVAIERFFAGESMFHRVTDASKAAFVHAVEWLRAHHFELFDVQWMTAHLARLGAVELPRSVYLTRLRHAVSIRSVEPVTIYHNPRCSKSRGALQILDERGVDRDVVEYLQAPPDRATIERILDALGGDPAELVRGDDARKKGLEASAYSDREGVVAVLLEHPELMQRPVVMKGDRAVIGRPPERIEALLS
jgi:leucyl/phenylalanyl-tRNA--protein transferase